MAPNAWSESSLLLPDSTSSQLSFSAAGQGSAPSLRHSPSLDIFERNIEHVGPAEHLSPHEAIDLGIPSVLDDAAEAFVNDQIDISVSSTVFIPPSPSMANLSALSSLSVTSQPISSPIINLAGDEELEIAQHNPWDISFGRNAPAARAPAPVLAAAAATATPTVTAPAPRSNIISPITAINFNPLAMLLPTSPVSSRTLPLPEPPTASMSAPAATANGRSTRGDFSDLMQSWNSRTAAQGTMAISPLSGADREGIPADGLGMGFGVVLDADEDKYIQRKTLAETLSTTSAKDLPALTGVFENPWN